MSMAELHQPHHDTPVGVHSSDPALELFGEGWTPDLHTTGSELGDNPPPQV